MTAFPLSSTKVDGPAAVGEAGAHGAAKGERDMPTTRARATATAVARSGSLGEFSMDTGVGLMPPLLEKEVTASPEAGTGSSSVAHQRRIS